MQYGHSKTECVKFMFVEGELISSLGELWGSLEDFWSEVYVLVLENIVVCDLARSGTYFLVQMDQLWVSMLHVGHVNSFWRDLLVGEACLVEFSESIDTVEKEISNFHF